MLGVGWTKMLLIGVVALIVSGPKDLPVVMSRLGKFVAQIRRMGIEFQREINMTTGLDQITDLRRSITDPLRRTAAEITREFHKTTSAGTAVATGASAPQDPAAESVVDEINAKLGMTTATPAPLVAPAVMTGPKFESPRPAEAIAPVFKPKKPRSKKPVGIEATAPATVSPLELFPEPAPAPKSRKPHVPNPKTEA